MSAARRALVALALATLVVTVPGPAGAERSPAPAVQSHGDVARGLIVKTTGAAPSAAALSAAGAALGPDGLVVGDDALGSQLSTIDFDHVVDVDVAARVATRVARSGDVEWAIPNRLRRVQARAPISTNDPLFSQQRNLWDSAASRRGGYSIKAPALWQATKGVPTTVVAVIDTGILAHPDLIGRTVAGYDFVSSASRARDGDGRDADPTDRGDWNVSGQCPYPGSTDSSWHGTFVAGQVAAAADNGTGITGVAPGVRVQPVRALGRCGGWDSDILDSIRWASGGTVRGVPANATPAPIVNLSIGGMASSARERRAVCRAYDDVARAGRARGSIFVAAAGNENDNANRAIPASCSEYISVGATSRKGFSASYSNVGSTVDLSAPGGDSAAGDRRDAILSLGNAGSRRARGNGYVRYEGTSMAAPQVAGGAALLHSLGFTTPASLRSALYASLTPFRPRSSAYAHKKIDGDNGSYRADLNCTTRGRRWCGRGLLDLSRVQAPASVPSISGAAVVGGTVTASPVRWVSAPPAVAYTWRADGAPVGLGVSYQPTAADVGRRLTVTVSPASGVFAQLGSTSAATGPVTG